MKDSGVEWIGEIPEDKQFVRLKFCADISTGNMDTQIIILMENIRFMYDHQLLNIVIHTPLMMRKNQS